MGPVHITTQKNALTEIKQLQKIRASWVYYMPINCPMSVFKPSPIISAFNGKNS